uniref:Protein phosphatase 1B n=1 Tax=Strigamia maritima TaxID=126957 RepID=T1IPX2_STRMM
MGAFLDKPKTDKYNENGSGNGLRYSLSSMQGWRIEMEDAHCAVLGLPQGLEDWSFFAVFDGHAGARVSAHCAENLLDSITQSEEFCKNANSCDLSSNAQTNVDNVKTGIRDGFLRLDEKMRSLISGEDKSGSTAVCCLISSHHIFIANCGDSRAVLSRDKKVMFSTLDHKPINPVEKERIQNAGGSVMIQRVNGSLAVSRALGDFEYKQVEGKGPCEQLVSPEPEIFVEKRDNELDEFLILACDGVWDVMSNDELCDFVRSRLFVSDNLTTICNEVVDTCLYKGSRDNMSIVLVTFPGAPKVSEEAVRKERELENYLEKKITGILEQGDQVELLHVMQILSEEEIPNLPPGGGLSAKRSFIESVFEKLRPKAVDNENGHGSSW